MRNLLRYIHKTLSKNRKTIATAESCTGGLLSKTLTEKPGSSRYFLLGIVAYDNRAKIKILKVPPKLIFKKGAVSKEVAKKMSESIRRLAGSDFGIGITGIAGPSGATMDKNVGTVFIALSKKGKTICKKFILPGSRSSIRRNACLKSLILLTSSF